MAGTTGSFGGAGCAAADGRAVLAAAGEPFSAGATGSPVGALARSPGFPAVSVMFPAALSGLFCLAALGVIAFALALLVDGEASAAEATAVSAFDWGRGALWGEAAPLFEAGCASQLAGALGTMEAILSFSTKTYPKSGLTLNMFSSDATQTPEDFLTSFKRIS